MMDLSLILKIQSFKYCEKQNWKVTSIVNNWNESAAINLWKSLIYLIEIYLKPKWSFSTLLVFNVSDNQKNMRTEKELVFKISLTHTYSAVLRKNVLWPFKHGQISFDKIEIQIASKTCDYFSFDFFHYQICIIWEWKEKISVTLLKN